MPSVFLACISVCHNVSHMDNYSISFSVNLSVSLSSYDSSVSHSFCQSVSMFCSIQLACQSVSWPVENSATWTVSTYLFAFSYSTRSRKVGMQSWKLFVNLFYCYSYLNLVHFSGSYSNVLLFFFIFPFSFYFTSLACNLQL